jgi:predicted DNA-binding antitoxin AbrB/MazE fold protein
MKLKPLKRLQKDQGKKIEIQRIRAKLKNIIFSKLGLKDEIENK